MLIPHKFDTAYGDKCEINKTKLISRFVEVTKYTTVFSPKL
jgi:hypothetical protein